MLVRELNLHKCYNIIVTMYPLLNYPKHWHISCNFSPKNIVCNHGCSLPKKTSQSFVKLCFGHCSKLITKQKAPVCPLGYQAIMNICKA